MRKKGFLSLVEAVRNYFRKTNALMYTRRYRFSGSEMMFRCPICKTFLPFDYEYLTRDYTEVMNALANGLLPCCDCGTDIRYWECGR